MWLISEVSVHSYTVLSTQWNTTGRLNLHFKKEQDAEVHFILFVFTLVAQRVTSRTKYFSLLLFSISLQESFKNNMFSVYVITVGEKTLK